MLTYHANNIAAGMTYDHVMENCEEMCSSWMVPCSYNSSEFQDLQDNSRCQRTSSHGYIAVGDEMMNSSAYYNTLIVRYVK